MDDIYKEAIGSLNSKAEKELKETVEDMAMIMPSIAAMGKTLEKESIDKGFTKDESFQIAKEYMVRALFPHVGAN